MIFTFGNYVVDIDVEKTKQIYKTLPLISEGCDCIGCLNFQSAVDVLPEIVHVFFKDLGVDLKRITECFVNQKNDDGTLHYGGFCHLCGRLIQGNSAWVEKSKNHSYFDRDSTYHVSDNFFVSFQEECAMVEKEFTEAILQMEFGANIPWVLDKENIY